ncbi:MAG: tyrosine-type recombinase/integrase [Eggerthellaceae bacterium]|nr:tyrosine-type recombinase/integrase [Eggerthellaceae bacterium]
MDRIIEFEGETARLFVDFVKYKKAMGYAMSVCGQYTLRGINRVVERVGVSDGAVVGPEAMREVCAKRDGESGSTREKRVVMLRQFRLFLASRGYRPTIPPPGTARAERSFVPHVFTEAEMARVISEADRDERGWVGLVARLIWCCGLRMGEVCALTLADVDLESGTLLVRRSKGDKTRLVPMSASMWGFMAEYVRSRGLEHADGARPLSEKPSGGHYLSGNAGKAVKAAMERSGVRTREGKVPRPHDARHGFAVRSLERAEEKGLDPYVSLPLLAQYMGHADIKSTEYYLRFTQGAYTRVLDAQAVNTAVVFGGDGQ